MKPERASVRRAAIGDIESIVPLFDLYRSFYGQPSEPDEARVFLSLRLQRNESIIFLAFDAGKPVGFTQLYPTFSSVAMKRAWILNDLFVHPDHRRRGFARALMNAATDFARANTYGVPRGVRDIELKTAADNTAAQALYAGMGWRPVTAFITFKKDLATAHPEPPAPGNT